MLDAVIAARPIDTADTIGEPPSGQSVASARERNYRNHS